MGKTYYTEFIQHCLRFYCRHTDFTEAELANLKEADRQNWLACEEAIHTEFPLEVDRIVEIYSWKGTLSEYIGSDVPTWRFLSRVERKVAEYRGIIG